RREAGGGRREAGGERREAGKDLESTPSAASGLLTSASRLSAPTSRLPPPAKHPRDGAIRPGDVLRLRLYHAWHVRSTAIGQREHDAAQNDVGKVQRQVRSQRRALKESSDEEDCRVYGVVPAEDRQRQSRCAGRVGGSSKKQQGSEPVCYVIQQDRKSTRLNSSHLGISYAVFCLKKKNK